MHIFEHWKPIEERAGIADVVIDRLDRALDDPAVAEFVDVARQCHAPAYVPPALCRTCHPELAKDPQLARCQRRSRGSFGRSSLRMTGCLPQDDRVLRNSVSAPSSAGESVVP